MGGRGICFIFLGLHLLQQATAMSTCKTVDVEQVRKRRIEAIRGQILSKLKLTKPPEVESEEMAVPEEVLSIYNSTVDMIRENADKEELAGREPSEEDYYGKEVQKVEMNRNEDIPPTNDVFLFTFNASRVREIVSRRPLLHHVELRMFRKPLLGVSENTEHRVELYRGLGNGNNSFRYLDSKFVWPGKPAEWLSFDVTDSVREWLDRKEENEVFQLSPPCAASGDVKLDIDGARNVCWVWGYHRVVEAPVGCRTGRSVLRALSLSSRVLRETGRYGRLEPESLLLPVPSDHLHPGGAHGEWPQPAEEGHGPRLLPHE
ncbi:transforming growth factor beta-1 proprotein isoform X2 [Spea bombifrons]|uniref:transforming growth factor beta-1 proprotein isoform X2 n=1 Tax=Spea bombifrons TaxID=233779 RepID=UPI00234A1BC6|nr:transforming growth factor beta-1 proprotein isoform X2 [Spea bombifrons]